MNEFCTDDKSANDVTGVAAVQTLLCEAQQGTVVVF